MPPPPPEKPPSDDEFKSSVYSFVRGEAGKREDLQRSISVVLKEIHETRAEMRTGFQTVDQRFRGIETRVSVLEEARRGDVKRRPSPMPAPLPISIPPERTALDTGDWSKKSRAEAEMYLEHRAREIAEEAVADARRDDEAAAWRRSMSFVGKIAAGVAVGLLLTMSGYALAKCNTGSTATLVAPPTH